MNVFEVEAEFSRFYRLDVRVLHPLDILEVNPLFETVLRLDGERARLLENAEAVAEGVIYGLLVSNSNTDVRDERVLVEVHGEHGVQRLERHLVEPCSRKVAVGQVCNRVTLFHFGFDSSCLVVCNDFVPFDFVQHVLRFVREHEKHEQNHDEREQHRECHNHELVRSHVAAESLGGFCDRGHVAVAPGLAAER